ncbi:MAG: biotin/lipoate A/B protein ligase family protein [Nitrospirota bacterium]
MKTWRFIDTGPLDAYMNMAIDEAIMKAVESGISPPTLRFYGWSSPSLSIGYFQKTEREINTDACLSLGIPVVRRPTGGKAVLHKIELTYSISSKTDSPLFSKGLMETYRVISHGLLKGLRNLGIDAEISEKRIQRKRSPACFSATAPYEITVKGRKIIGSAQKRSNGVFLQQGSILIDLDLALYCLIFPAEEKPSRQMTAISIETAKDIKSIRPSFIKGIEESFGIKLEHQNLTPYELECAEILVREKYSKDEWNFRM